MSGSKEERRAHSNWLAIQAYVEDIVGQKIGHDERVGPRRYRNMSRREYSSGLGAVKYFNPEKGFGFVRLEDGREAFFRTELDCAGKHLAQKGARGSFECAAADRGLRVTRILRCEGCEEDKPSKETFLGRTFALEWRGQRFAVTTGETLLERLDLSGGRAVVERRVVEIGYAEILRIAAPVAWRAETEGLPSLEAVGEQHAKAKQALAEFEAELATRLPPCEMITRSVPMSFGKDGNDILFLPGGRAERSDGRKVDEVATAKELAQLKTLREKAALGHTIDMAKDIFASRSMERAKVGIAPSLNLVEDGRLPLGRGWDLIIQLSNHLNPPASLELAKGEFLDREKSANLLEAVAKFAARWKDWVLRDISR